jgi:hypothetical protein
VGQPVRVSSGQPTVRPDQWQYNEDQDDRRYCCPTISYALLLHPFEKAISLVVARTKVYSAYFQLSSFVTVVHQDTPHKVRKEFPAPIGTAPVKGNQFLWLPRA